MSIPNFLAMHAAVFEVHKVRVLIYNHWPLLPPVRRLSHRCPMNSQARHPCQQQYTAPSALTRVRRWRRRCSRRRRKLLRRHRPRCISGLHAGAPSTLSVRGGATKNCPATVHPGLSRTDGAHRCGLSRMKRRTGVPRCAPVRLIEDAIRLRLLQPGASEPIPPELAAAPHGSDVRQQKNCVIALHCNYFNSIAYIFGSDTLILQYQDLFLA